MRKYNIGDKVRINPDLYKFKDCKSCLSDDMRTFSGRMVTISGVSNNEYYTIKEDPDQWYWSDDCFVNYNTLTCNTLL